MVSAITSGQYSYHYQSSDSLGGLQAQLARYQKQLSECLNCDSYNTPAGKRDAQQLGDKIAQIQSKIGKIQQNQVIKPPAAEEKVAETSSNQSVGSLGKNIDIFV